RAKEGANGVGWCVHDGFTAEIERSIHDDRYAGTLAEFVDEMVVERIDFLLDGLRAGAAINVRDGGDDTALFRPHLSGEDHEGRVVSGFQILGSGFLFDGGSEGTPPLPEFHGVVNLGVHLWIARVRNNGAAAEGPRAELHSALIPTENSALGQKFSGRRRGAGKARGDNFVRFEGGLDRLIVKRGSKIRVPHRNER